MEKKNGTENISKKQVAYDKIKEMIINGKIPKEAPLVERQLCETLSISRTPVREALRELAGDDLVEIIEGKGVYVKRIEFRDMVEIFELREALEQMAMKLFVERADEDAVQALQECMKKQEEAYEKDDHEEFMEMDMEIHNLIAERAQNNRLKNSISNIYEQIKMIAISAKDDQKVRDLAITAHRKILQAVQNRDSEAAQKAMVEHVVEVKNLHKDRYYLL
ncbi:MAG: GntR family transcriptional regulator [Hespellia sp.]|nr:GntR family transcriptional regulator [Hespellia sp.]